MEMIDFQYPTFIFVLVLPKLLVWGVSCGVKQLFKDRSCYIIIIIWFACLSENQFLRIEVCPNISVA